MISLLLHTYFQLKFIHNPLISRREEKKSAKYENTYSRYIVTTVVHEKNTRETIYSRKLSNNIYVKITPIVLCRN